MGKRPKYKLLDSYDRFQLLANSIEPCSNCFTFISCLWLNLAKSYCGWYSFQLYHKFEGKKNNDPHPFNVPWKSHFGLSSIYWSGFFFQFFDVEKLAKFTFKLAKLVKFITLGKTKFSFKKFDPKCNNFLAIQSADRNQIVNFPRPKWSKLGASLTSEVYLSRIQHKMEDWLVVWDFKTSGSGEHWGLRLNRKPDGNVQMEREGRFQVSEWLGTRDKVMMKYQKGHTFTIPLVMEIFYKPGICSISIGQRKKLNLRAPTKPAIFDLISCKGLFTPNTGSFIPSMDF